MRPVRRQVTGFVHRFTYAVLAAGLAWYSCTFPPAFEWQVQPQKMLCYGLTFPTSVIGLITYPQTGIDVIFNEGASQWCHHCTAQEVLWYHAKFAVPIYVLLFYLPSAAGWIVHRWRSGSAVETRGSSG